MAESESNYGKVIEKNSRFGAASFISGSRKNRTRCSSKQETIRNISVEHIPERALECTAGRETLESVGESREHVDSGT